MPGNELVQALGRGLELLLLLAESRTGLRMGELTAATRLKQPTAHNLLRTLCSHGFAVQEDGVYRVGPAAQRLGTAVSTGRLLDQAEAAVRRLAELLPGSILSFCEPVGIEILVRMQLFPERAMLQRGDGKPYSHYHTASGLAFLAYADPQTRQGIQLQHPFEVEGRVLWQSEARLEKFLKEVRARGYVVPPFNADAKFKLAAWPALSKDGRFLGALGAAWHVAPGEREDATTKTLDALREAASLIQP